MSSVVSVTTEDGDEGRDPFGGDRIEIDEETLRAVSPAAWLGRVRHRLDAVATRLTYDR